MTPIADPWFTASESVDSGPLTKAHTVRDKSSTLKRPVFSHPYNIYIYCIIYIYICIHVVIFFNNIVSSYFHHIKIWTFGFAASLELPSKHIMKKYDFQHQRQHAVGHASTIRWANGPGSRRVQILLWIHLLYLCHHSCCNGLPLRHFYAKKTSRCWSSSSWPWDDTPPKSPPKTHMTMTIVKNKHLKMYLRISYISKMKKNCDLCSIESFICWQKACMSFSASKDILEMPQAALQSSKVLNLQGGSPVTTNHDINTDPIWIGMSSIKIKTCKN